MRRARHLAAAALAFIAAPAAAQQGPQQELRLAVDNLAQDGAYAKAVVRLTNDAARSYESVSVSCAFLAKGRALETSDAVISNVARGATAFETLLVRQRGVDEARCRIVRSR